jgi:GDP-L-fucose synthase
MLKDSKYLNKKIYIAGHTGMVGSAVKREFELRGYNNLLLKDYPGLNLINQLETDDLFETEKPEIVIMAAARVGGILANNTYRADFIYDNLMIEANVINAAYKNNVDKLIFLGSSCIYPKMATQPLKEESLLSGYLEVTNEPYAIAKIAGIKLCENFYRQYGCNFYSVMPTNLYGPHDNFNLETSHVLPAFIRKFHEAKVNNHESVTIWGSGKPMREFLYVEDLANAILFLMENIDANDLYENNISHLNIGSGNDITIDDLATLIAEIIGFDGKIIHDSAKPDGTPRKLMDVSRINQLGWEYKTELREGLIKTYKWFKDNMKIRREN